MNKKRHLLMECLCERILSKIQECDHDYDNMVNTLFSIRNDINKLFKKPKKRAKKVSKKKSYSPFEEPINYHTSIRS